MKRTFPIIAAVAAVAVGGWFVFSGTDATNSTQLNPIAGAANAQSADAADIDTSTIQEMSLGNQENPFHNNEYPTYTSPHCPPY